MTYGKTIRQQAIETGLKSMENVFGMSGFACCSSEKAINAALDKQAELIFAEIEKRGSWKGMIELKRQLGAEK